MPCAMQMKGGGLNRQREGGGSKVQMKGAGLNRQMEGGGSKMQMKGGGPNMQMEGGSKVQRKAPPEKQQGHVAAGISSAHS